MQKIKLFVDAHVFDGIHQGTVTFIAGLYSELIKNENFEVYVGSNNRNIAEKHLKSTNFIHINYHTHSGFKRLFFTIPKALKKHKIDFAHFQYISPWRKDCKFIVTIHDLLFLEYPKYFPLIYRIKNSILFFISSRRADIVTTVSDYSKNSIHRLFRIDKNSIWLTPNAVSQNEHEVTPNPLLLGKKFLLYVSRIEPRKNQALLIELWKELRINKAYLNLVIIGSDGIIDENFNNQISTMSTEEKNSFFWLKDINNSELSWFYKHCDLFVFPSSAEGFGIPPIEAALHGAKVLCSKETAMGEFNFFDNFLFSPGNREEFKSKIIYALDHPFPHENVKHLINLRYNWSHIAKTFSEKILESSAK